LDFNENFGLFYMSRRYNVGLAKKWLNMEMYDLFTTNIKWMQFLALAQIAVLAYFMIQLGLSLWRLPEWKAYFDNKTAEDVEPLCVRFIKRAALGLIIWGVLKLIAAIYMVITVNDFAR
jgi:hypothetical protein